LLTALKSSFTIRLRLLPKQQKKQNCTEELVKLGYTNVKEFSGEIRD
jgi:hypothetical protein